MSKSSRSGHYFEWFIVFGVIAGVVSFLGAAGISSEAIWLIGAGVLGLLIAHNSIKEGGFAKFYDIIIGVIFMLAGLAGLVYNFKASVLPSFLADNHLLAGTGQNAVLIGLSLALFPAIVHLLLGFDSFRHGIANDGKK